MSPDPAPPTQPRQPLWVGTYPAAGAGTPAGLGEGIWRVDLDPATGRLSDAAQVARTPAPSFLALHPSGRVLYAVGEQADGTVTAFAVPGLPAGSDELSRHDELSGPDALSGPDDPEAPGAASRLEPLDTVSSGGADPCHLLLAPDARALYVANYSSGTLGVLPLDPDGRFTSAVRTAAAPAQVLGHAGSGPDADRQESPHAHSTALAPGGTHVLVVDLGTDELRRLTLDRTTALLTADGIAARLPAGTGPRHLTFSPDGRFAYVVGELDASVAVLAWDVAGVTGTLVQSVPAGEPSLGGPRPAPSHVVLDGDSLLVGVRGVDVLAEYRVGPDGLLTPLSEVRVPGGCPRHFAVVGPWVVTAAQVGDLLAVLGPVPDVAATSSVLALAAPACVLTA